MHLGEPIYLVAQVPCKEFNIVLKLQIQKEVFGIDGVNWEQINQVQEEDIVFLHCFLEGGMVARFEVG